MQPLMSESMKKALLRISLIALPFLVPLLNSGVFADPPGPPGPGGPPGGGGLPVGGPVGDGIGILLSLGLAYGCYKIYEIWKMKGDADNKRVI